MAAPRPAAPTTLTRVTPALMTTSSVASLRAAPTMAVYGLARVFLHLVPAIVFLLPTALSLPPLDHVTEGNCGRSFGQAVEDVEAFLAGAPVREPS